MDTAIIDNIKKISDTIWESLSTYKDALRLNRGLGFDHGARLHGSAGSARRRLQTALEPDTAISEAARRAYFPLIAWGTFSVRFDASGKTIEVKAITSQRGTIRSKRRTLEKPTRPGVHYRGGCQI